MDFVSIGTSAILSALLFIALEFTIILPLFRRIVTDAVNKMVNEQLIPSISHFVDDKVNDLSVGLTKSLMGKIRGMLGGRQKGVNSLIAKLSDPDLDPDDIDLDSYEPSTIDKLVSIADNLAPVLQNSLLQRREQNGNKENQKESSSSQNKDGLQNLQEALQQAQIRS